jgi:hypothetical protein
LAVAADLTDLSVLPVRPDNTARGHDLHCAGIDEDAGGRGRGAACHSVETLSQWKQTPFVTGEVRVGGVRHRLGPPQIQLQSGKSCGDLSSAAGGFILTKQQSVDFVDTWKRPSCDAGVSKV